VVPGRGEEGAESDRAEEREDAHRLSGGGSVQVAPRYRRVDMNRGLHWLLPAESKPSSRRGPTYAVVSTKAVRVPCFGPPFKAR
jgi:hypothetical protein